MKLYAAFLPLLIYCACCFGAPPETVARAVFAHDYAALSSCLQAGQVSLGELEAIARESHVKPLQQALKAAKVIAPLVESLGMGRNELLSLCLTIETSLKKTSLEGRGFRVTVGARIIEYDAKTERFFIHIGSEGTSLIEQGYYKRVTKSILYDERSPELVANCRGTLADLKELKITERFQGLPSIVEARALIRHKTKDACVELLLKHYNAHSLRTIFNTKSYHFSNDEKQKIASDILAGLAAIHGKGYVHRDLHAGNFLVEVKGANAHRRVKAVVADFGKTMKAISCRGISSQAVLEYRSPEAIVARRLKSGDYFATDIYAIGCLLYKLYFDKEPPWFQDRSFFRRKGYGAHCSVRAARHKRAALIDSHTAKRRAFLKKRVMRHEASKEERFEYMILMMLHPDPELRKSARYWQGFIRS